ncbi:hypothetical protein IW150_007351 [Coemansia sp. RSA 2607]|nr:hypothetical protein IW150_007351 [Coemansia sp. RSA 2607]
MSPTQSQPRQQQHGPKPRVSSAAAPTAQTMSDQDVLRRTTRVLRQLYHRERQFLSSLTPAQLQTLTQQDNPSLSEQHHYGEVCFVLLGLKPCALMDYADRTTLLPQYIARVVEPSIVELNRLGEMLAGQQQQEKEKLGEGGGVYPRGFELRCRRIEHQVESPEGGSWQGAYVLYDERQKESRRWAEALLDGARGKVDEDELAQALDYPGSLPKTSDEMRSIVSVSYLGRMK